MIRFIEWVVFKFVCLHMNLQVLNTIALVYPEISCYPKLFACGTTNARLVVFNDPTRPSEIQYSIWAIFSEKLCSMLHHELGHFYHPQGLSENLPVCELAAWIWAFENGIMESPSSLGMALGAYLSYIVHDPTLSQEQKHKVIDVFMKALKTNYIQ